MKMTRQERVWEILDGSNVEGRLSLGFNIFILVLIFLNVIAVGLETVHELATSWATGLHVFEVVSVVIFSAEYLLRLWSCTADEEHEHPILGRLEWALSPMALVDLVAVLPFFLPMLIGIDMRFIRALRLLRLFRLLKVGRYAKSLRLMRSVVTDKREELSITVFALVLCLVVSASAMYYVEKDAQPEKFSSIPQALWWAVATLSTVGYGDTYPITPLGQALASVVAIVGVGLFGLPAGILASGFMEQVAKSKAELEEKEPAPPPSRTEGFGCPHCGKDIRITFDKPG